MKIGLVKANFPGERRVPLLPKDIKDFKNEILVEEGFGKFLDIDDQEYIDKGCHILSRAEIFAESEAIFSLKLIQPTDYSHLREGQDDYRVDTSFWFRTIVHERASSA